MRSSVVPLVFALVLLPSAAMACDVKVSDPVRSSSGSWTYAVNARSSFPSLAVLSLRETNEDFVAVLAGSAGRETTDVAPTRHAIERLIAWTWGRDAWQLEVTGLGSVVRTPPPVSA